jgi:hypothetical protein
MGFERGDKVLCVDDEWSCEAFQLVATPYRPIRGMICTVREVYECHDGVEPAVGIRLFELVNPITAWAEARIACQASACSLKANSNAAPTHGLTLARPSQGHRKAVAPLGLHQTTCGFSPSRIPNRK